VRPAELSAGSGSSKPGAGPTCTVTVLGAPDELTAWNTPASLPTRQLRRVPAPVQSVEESATPAGALTVSETVLPSGTPATSQRPLVTVPERPFRPTVTPPSAADKDETVVLPVVLPVVLLACAEGVPEGDAETRFGDLALGEALGKGLFGESVRVAEVLADALGVGAPYPRRRCRARRPRARAGYLTPTHPASRLLGDEQRECRDTRLTRGHAAPLFGPDSAPEAVGAPH